MLVTKIVELSLTHFVSNIRHQHNRMSTAIPTFYHSLPKFDSTKCSFFYPRNFKKISKNFFVACQNLIVYIWVSAGSGATDVSLFTDLIFTIWGLSQPTISVQWLIDKQCDSCFVTHTLWLIQLVCLLYRIYNFPQTSSVYTCIKYLPK